MHHRSSVTFSEHGKFRNGQFTVTNGSHPMNAVLAGFAQQSGI
jgi:hypothetical protein